uniref:hypothetical protein n=1 Tax=Eubacterium cellulosolvens TaxID=29322 RepID=UPI0004888E7D|nr:hypothetical protein [[Eubacterium] cellulosolvens]
MGLTAGIDLHRYDEKSKYVRTSRERELFRQISVLFVFVMYVMPQYFGIQLPFFDLSALRIMIVIVLFDIFSDRGRMRDLLWMIYREPMTVVLFPYIVVLIYTMLLRADFNAFFNPLIEILTMYLMIYMIRYVFGVSGFIRLITICVWILTILGIVECFTQESPFAHLVTIYGIYTGRFIRSGHYRIMGNAVMSLGYGLMMVTMLPFAVLEEVDGRYRISYLKRPLLVILLIVDVFMTGSRSTLGVFLAELVPLFFLQEKRELKISSAVLSIVLIVFSAVLVVCQKTSFGNYVLLQLAMLVDTVFGTEWVVNFGGAVGDLVSSTHYREVMKGIWTIDWLNPFLGLGRKKSFAGMVDGFPIYSIDQYYLAEYIRYAWPGVLAYGLFLIWSVKTMAVSALKKSVVARAMLVGTIFYLLNLYYVDALQTLKYLYINIAIVVAVGPASSADEEKEKSGYIKKRWISGKKIFGSV